MKNVLFYTDNPDAFKKKISQENQEKIRRQLGADATVFHLEGSTQGFRSSLDWNRICTKGGFAAIVIFDADDPCVFGLSYEVRENSDLPVYKLCDEYLLDCSNVRPIGHKAFHDPSQERFRHEVQFYGYSEHAIYHLDHWLSRGEIVFIPEFVENRPAYFKVRRIKKAEGRQTMLVELKKIPRLWVEFMKPKVTKV